jgi:hypothetical protein
MMKATGFSLLSGNLGSNAPGHPLLPKSFFF